jgi:hypothetical protein
MKTILFSLLILICLSATSQVAQIHINADDVLTIIDDEIEFAFNEIEDIILDLEDLTFNTEMLLEDLNFNTTEFLEDFNIDHFWNNNEDYYCNDDIENIQLELLDLMEDLGENEELFHEKIELWNEANEEKENFF